MTFAVAAFKWISVDGFRCGCEVFANLLHFTTGTGIYGIQTAGTRYDNVMMVWGRNIDRLGWKGRLHTGNTFLGIWPFFTMMYHLHRNKQHSTITYHTIHFPFKNLVLYMKSIFKTLRKQVFRAQPFFTLQDAPFIFLSFYLFCYRNHNTGNFLFL